MTTLTEAVRRMRAALTIIANWKLPETSKFWDAEKTRPTSYEAEYGSNGARDYMRKLAADTLLAATDLLAEPAAPQAEPSTDELRHIAQGIRMSASDDESPAAYVLAGWRAALRSRASAASAIQDVASLIALVKRWEDECAGVSTDWHGGLKAAAEDLRAALAAAAPPQPVAQGEYEPLTDSDFNILEGDLDKVDSIFEHCGQRMEPAYLFGRSVERAVLTRMGMDADRAARSKREGGGS